MSNYLVRRVLYGLLVLLGVNLITFVLFFKVNSPDDMARMALGGKRVTEQAIEQWKREKGYDLPLLFNTAVQGTDQFTQTIFFQKSMPMFVGEFGSADDGRNIADEILRRAGPSLALAVPVFVLGLLVNIAFALLLTFFRGTYLDLSGVVLCVLAMSISGLFYIIGGQFLFSKTLALVPISGYAPGGQAWRFLILPVFIGVLGGVGAGTRWYRTIFLEEINKDYVRTARSKGLSEAQVLSRHVLRNGLIPILTGSVSVIPLLFMGSLISESFFGIPGLGSYTIEAIQSQDFGVVRAMVFIGSALYLVGLILTDIAYTIADPRVRLS
ncbi:ABC transporter permease [Limnobacter humi]|uniref:ABC transporter permease n=1 Tax=Limnobacter humi TaxID=1778671 RepID=A0ABT1WFK8_9BURK|nr:ABC transporter permease [Limnobacter humi]MCQ8896295.1 ABC transporter permease [Limnobacter humi]